MSGLAKLLAGHREPGVYHWTSAAEAADVAHAVEHAGWDFVRLDTWQVEGRSGFLRQCQRAFGLSEDAAADIDALAGGLAQMQPRGKGIVLLWEGWSPLARSGRQDFDAAVKAFKARVEAGPEGPFAVLLKGPGPGDVELSELDPHHH